jgi:hypothetical protein
MERFHRGCYLLAATIGGLPAVALAQSDDVIVVGNEAELVAAMVPANAYRRIQLLNRYTDPAVFDYQVSATLNVPDGAIVEGAGVMRYDADGLPAGFEPGTETRVGAASNYQIVGGRPEIFALGNGSSLQRMTVVSYQPGNAVGIMSSLSGPVEGSVSECDIFGSGFVPGASNFGPQGGDGFLPGGPISRGVFVRTRHPGSSVTARVERSIIHANGSNAAVFVANITKSARITVFLTQNVLKDGLRQLDVVGGASGNGARDSSGSFLFQSDGNLTIVHSRGNLYSGRGLTDTGVILEGGYDGRGFPTEERPGASHNTIRFDSVLDRITNVGTGLFLEGGLRANLLAGLSSFNTVDLQLLGTTIRTLPPEAGRPAPRDLAVCVTTGVGPLQGKAGDGDSIRALLRDVDGSGPRANLYSLACNAQPGSDNTFEFIGNARAFEQTTDDISPPPPPDSFTAP